MDAPDPTPSTAATTAKRVFVVGASGYIGRHAVRELVGRGHDVVCLVRRLDGDDGSSKMQALETALAGAEIRYGDVTDAASIARDGLRDEPFDATVSCLATRTGTETDSWRIEHAANLNVLHASAAVGVRHFVLLSAICVQKPRLAFQHAKLAFEHALMASSPQITFSIVRPTAFFKSLSGQVENVKRGKPFVMFGRGDLTACKPISEADLARFLADCLDDPKKQNAILPIGGPGAAITPAEQGAMIFEACGVAPRYRRAPVFLLDTAIAVLGALGRVSAAARDKAELARIGRYYATESMLALDPATGRYEADATPSYGRDTLVEFYHRVAREGLAGQELGAHAVFARGERSKKASARE